MKTAILSAVLVLATVCATAQAPPRTHKIPTTDTNNVWTGNNDFRGTVTCNGVPCAGGAPAEVNGQDISPKSVTADVYYGDGSNLDGAGVSGGFVVKKIASLASNTVYAAGSVTYSSGTYTAAVGFQPLPSALAAGQVYFVNFPSANPGAANLTIGSLPTKEIRVLNSAGTALTLAGGEIAPGTQALYYDGTQFVLSLSSATPVQCDAGDFATGIDANGDANCATPGAATKVVKGETVTTGSIAGSSSAVVTLTWSVAFAGTPTGYNCDVLEATTTGATLRKHHITAVSASSISALVVNDDTGAHTGTLSCTAVR